MRLLSSIYTTYRDRGFRALTSAIANSGRAAVWRYLLRRQLLTKSIHSYKMVLDLNDRGLSRTLLLFGTREIDHKLLLEKIIKPNMTILDIGANIGYYPLMELNLLGPKGRLIAVEPFPQNIALLKKNLLLNGYENEVEIIEGAVSNKSSTELFYLSSHSNLGTFHPEGSGAGLITGKTINVRTYTVPELANLYGPPDLIRMDVEGHEVEIINGMIDAIKIGAIRPTIIFETHLTRYSKNHNMANSLERLFACNYSVPLAATSQQSGTQLLRSRGYAGNNPIKTDGVERVIVDNVTTKDAIELICHAGGLRTVILAPN